MIHAKLITFAVLCVFGASSVVTHGTGENATVVVQPIPKASKVSEFYIGDLLRTPEKTETANNPSSTPEYTHMGLARAKAYESRVINYQIQGHPEYSEEVEGRSPYDHQSYLERPPVNVYEKYSIKQAGVVERNVMATTEGGPVAPRYPHPSSHHKKEDCNKKKHHHPVASSEEVYERAHAPYHSHPSHHHPVEEDYRDSPSTYHQDYDHDEPHHQSYSQGSTTSSQPSRSKSLNSNSKSQSSYTTSKSSSTSKTVEPADKKPKVHVFSHTKPVGHGYHRSRPQSEDVPYKVKSHHHHNSDERPVRYTNPQEEAPVTPYYEEYQGPSTHTRGRPRPVQRPSYEDRNVRYQVKEPSYETTREPQYDSDERYVPYSAHGRDHQHPTSPTEHPSTVRKYQTTPSSYQGSEDDRAPYSPQPPPRRPRKKVTQHHGYAPEDPRDRHTPSHPVRSHEPQQGNNYDQPRHHERYQSERPRESRSSAQFKPAPTAGRGASQGLVTKESRPQKSNSVSYSESSYNMNEPVRSKSMSIIPVTEGRNYERPLKMANPLHRETGESRARGQSYQSAYKPHNSEYPASYMNDQYRDDSHSEEGSYEEPHRPYGNEEVTKSHTQRGSTKTKSDITGYKENYSPEEPLELDDEFFRKYGISKKAKIIVASAKEPNLFVADGTRIKEGEESSHEGAPKEGGYHHEEPYSKEEPYREGPEEPYNQRPEEPYHQRPEEPYHQRPEEPYHQRPEEPYHQRPVHDESYEEKPQVFGPKNIPGSFTDLVGIDPKFLRGLQLEQDEDVAGYDPSLDELVFRSGVGDPKKFVSSLGSRQIVQSHGDGVSKIIFNQGHKKAASENKAQYESPDEKVPEESKVVEVKVKGDEKKENSSS